jgi:hypothetical protein
VGDDARMGRDRGSLRLGCVGISGLRHQRGERPDGQPTKNEAAASDP